MNQNTEETMMRISERAVKASGSPGSAKDDASMLEAFRSAWSGAFCAEVTTIPRRVVERIVAKYISTREGGGAVVISKDLITALAVMIESS